MWGRSGRRAYEGVYRGEAERGEGDCGGAGGDGAEERVSGGERVLRDVDVRAFVHAAGAGGVYGEVAAVGHDGVADDSVAVPDTVDRR